MLWLCKKHGYVEQVEPCCLEASLVSAFTGGGSSTPPSDSQTGDVGATTKRPAVKRPRFDELCAVLDEWSETLDGLSMVKKVHFWALLEGEVKRRRLEIITSSKK